MEETRPFPQIEQQENKVALACYVFSWAVEAFLGGYEVEGLVVTDQVAFEMYDIPHRLQILNGMVQAFMQDSNSFRMLLKPKFDNIAYAFHPSLDSTYPGENFTHSRVRVSLQRRESEVTDQGIMHQLLIEAIEGINDGRNLPYHEVLISSLVRLEQRQANKARGDTEATVVSRDEALDILEWAKGIRLETILIADTPYRLERGGRRRYLKNHGVALRMSKHILKCELELVVFPERTERTIAKIVMPLVEGNRYFLKKVYEGFETILGTSIDVPWPH